MSDADATDRIAVENHHTRPVDIKAITPEAFAGDSP